MTSDSDQQQRLTISSLRPPLDAGFPGLRLLLRLALRLHAFTMLELLTLAHLAAAFFFGVTVTAGATGAAKFPPGACETLPGTSSGAGFVNGP